MASSLTCAMETLAGSDFSSDRTGSQLYVSRYGELIADVAVGFRAEGVPMTNSSSGIWLCCSKPVLLLALVQLLMRHDMDEGEAIATLVPEYAKGGKTDVTLAHVLTHTVPYESLGLAWTPDGVRSSGEKVVMASSWSAALKAICEMPLAGKPGEIVTYTGVSNWLLLAEIIERLTGRRHEELVDELVLRPLGMDETILYLQDQETDNFDWAPMWALHNDRDPVLLDLDTPAWSRHKFPGLSCRGPVRDMAKPIECAAGWLCGARLESAWRAKILEPRRVDLGDPVFEGAEVQWSLGLCADPMAYGLPLSRRAVGHTGAHSSIVFADLDTGIVISFLATGMMPKARDWARKRRLVRAVYKDLGMTLDT